MDFLSPLLAYVAGIVTILNPCVLPILPIVLATALREGKLGPVALAIGLSTTFTVVFVLIATLGGLLSPAPTADSGLALGSLALDTNAAATEPSFDIQSLFVVLGGLLLILLGLTQILPQGQRVISWATSGLQTGANRILDSIKLGGLGGQFLIGAVLGLAWSPCIGPTLGAASTLSLSASNFAVVLMIALLFSAGVSTVLLALSYGSRQLISERRAALMSSSAWIKPATGALMIIVGLLLVTGGFKVIESWILDNAPGWLQAVIGVSTTF